MLTTQAHNTGDVLLFTGYEICAVMQIADAAENMHNTVVVMHNNSTHYLVVTCTAAPDGVQPCILPEAGCFVHSYRYTENYVAAYMLALETGAQIAIGNF